MKSIKTVNLSALNGAGTESAPDPITGLDTLTATDDFYIITGILQDFTSQGIGTRLFEEMHRWAREKELHRLELNVMVHNETALALYKKMGFEIEGEKKHPLIVNDTYVDEYWMAKLLP